MMFAGFVGLALVSAGLSGQSFRGLPLVVKVESVTLSPAPANVAANLAHVCYRFATLIPSFDYASLTVLARKGVKVQRKAVDEGVIDGDRQPQGVELQFSVRGFDFTAFLSSATQPFALPQVQYFNSAVRSTAGVEKPLELLAFELSYVGMVDPQYEWVSICESIPFGVAFSGRYVRSLFDGPGPIGTMEGNSRFELDVHFPGFLRAKPFKQVFPPSLYTVPIFGLSALESDDERMIAFSHHANSVNAVKANLDEAALNEYLVEHESIVRAFEESYGIHVALPVDTARLVEIVKEVAGLRSLPIERTAG